MTLKEKMVDDLKSEHLSESAARLIVELVVRSLADHLTGEQCEDLWDSGADWDEYEGAAFDRQLGPVNMRDILREFMDEEPTKSEMEHRIERGDLTYES